MKLERAIVCAQNIQHTPDSRAKTLAVVWRRAAGPSRLFATARCLEEFDLLNRWNQKTAGALRRSLLLGKEDEAADDWVCSVVATRHVMKRASPAVVISQGGGLPLYGIRLRGKWAGKAERLWKGRAVLPYAPKKTDKPLDDVCEP